MNPKLCEILPAFLSEVEECLRKLGRSEVAEQLGEIRLDRWTHDPQADAIHIAVAGGRDLNIVEKNIIGIKYGESVSLDDLEGIVVIDLDNFGRIQSIELIGRRDVLKRLKKGNTQ